MGTEIQVKAGVEAWRKRRPGWSRNDSVRWLNERSDLVLAWLRRVDRGAPERNAHAMGRWLQGERPGLFGRVHERLEKTAAGDRARVRVMEVVR